MIMSLLILSGTLSLNSGVRLITQKPHFYAGGLDGLSFIVIFYYNALMAYILGISEAFKHLHLPTAVLNCKSRHIFSPSVFYFF